MFIFVALASSSLLLVFFQMLQSVLDQPWLLLFAARYSFYGHLLLFLLLQVSILPLAICTFRRISATGLLGVVGWNWERLRAAWECPDPGSYSVIPRENKHFDDVRLVMAVHLWLRAETKPNERRTHITPERCKDLVQAGKKKLRALTLFKIVYNIPSPASAFYSYWTFHIF